MAAPTHDTRVLVVGTTPDYIDLILARWPGRAVFLTHPEVRLGTAVPAPPRGAEVLCDLRDAEEAVALVMEAGRAGGWRLSGVACYDCESLRLAAQIAAASGLPFTDPDAVAACRSKLRSKQLWQEAGVPCPRVARVRTAEEAAQFQGALGRPIVLKPLSGSGSELTFLCGTQEDTANACATLAARLAHHPDERLYGRLSADSEDDPHEVFVAEEYVEGTEFSADFVIAGGRPDLLRTTRKITHPNSTFGTTMAYVVPSGLADGVIGKQLPAILAAAASALGVRHGLCMVDFILRDGHAVLLELTPRPGGDCLPDLLLHSGGLDTIGAALDLAEGRTVRAPSAHEWRPLVGLRLFATHPGVVSRIDVGDVVADERIVLCRVTKAPGHRVILPPDDYDSRILGHILFVPTEGEDLPEACLGLLAGVRVLMEDGGDG